MVVHMDSISPVAVRTAGDHTVDENARTFFGKLMETFAFWLGTAAPATTTAQAPRYRRSSHTSSRQAP